MKISKKGDMVILEPFGRSKWPEGFWDAFPVDQDFKTPEALPAENFTKVVTHNVREFGRIDKLKVEDWAWECHCLKREKVRR